MTKKKYFRISEVAEQVIQSKKETGSKGWGTGFHTLDSLISYKAGASTTIYSYNHQGKSQFAIQESVFMALEHNVVTLCYLTEIGTKAEIILDIIQTYVGKELTQITDEEIFSALAWANDFFVIIDSANELLTIREIYTLVKDIQTECGIKINNLIIDHFGNIKDDSEQKFYNIADKVKFVMQAVTRTSKKFDLHTFILFHVRDVAPIKCKTTEKFYLPKPEGYEISGGQQAGFLGQQMISVWRPVAQPDKYGIIDPVTAMPYELNETHITVSKSKPKFVGKLGSAIIYFDIEKQQYYEKIAGKNYYMGSYNNPQAKVESTPLQPNYKFEDNVNF